MDTVTSQSHGRLRPLWSSAPPLIGWPLAGRPPALSLTSLTVRTGRAGQWLLPELVGGVSDVHAGELLGGIWGRSLIFSEACLYGVCVVGRHPRRQVEPPKGVGAGVLPRVSGFPKSGGGACALSCGEPRGVLTPRKRLVSCVASPQSLRWLGARLAPAGLGRLQQWRLPRWRLADLTDRFSGARRGSLPARV